MCGHCYVLLWPHCVTLRLLLWFLTVVGTLRSFSFLPRKGSRKSSSCQDDFETKTWRSGVWHSLFFDNSLVQMPLNNIDGVLWLYGAMGLHLHVRFSVELLSRCKLCLYFIVHKDRSHYWVSFSRKIPATGSLIKNLLRTVHGQRRSLHILPDRESFREMIRDTFLLSIYFSTCTGNFSRSVRFLWFSGLYFSTTESLILWNFILVLHDSLLETRFLLTHRDIAGKEI